MTEYKNWLRAVLNKPNRFTSVHLYKINNIDYNKPLQFKLGGRWIVIDDYHLCFARTDKTQPTVISIPQQIGNIEFTTKETANTMVMVSKKGLTDSKLGLFLEFINSVNSAISLDDFCATLASTEVIFVPITSIIVFMREAIQDDEPNKVKFNLKKLKNKAMTITDNRSFITAQNVHMLKLNDKTLETDNSMICIDGTLIVYNNDKYEVFDVEYIKRVMYCRRYRVYNPNKTCDILLSQGYHVKDDENTMYDSKKIGDIIKSAKRFDKYTLIF